MSGAHGKTRFQGIDAEIQTPFGELLTASEISYDIPEAFEWTNNTLISKNIDITATIKIKTETLIYLLSLALVSSVQQLPPMPFINTTIMPDDQMPLIITMKNVKLWFSLSEINIQESNALEHELKCYPSDLLINGASLTPKRSKMGI